MKSTFATLALVGAAAAAPHAGHAAFHAKKDLFSGLTELAAGSSIIGEVSTLMSDAMGVLSKLGAQPAINSQTATADSWVGAATEGDAVVNTIVNKGSKDFVFTCWGAAASWVNVHKPTIAVRVPAGKNVTVSHAVAQGGLQNTGACAPVFDDTDLAMGQINQAWMEFTFTHDQWSSSTYDLSLLRNMNGANMTIAGPECMSNHQKCSFQCNKGLDNCFEAADVELIGCAVGSQPKAQSGYAFGAVQGGCSDISNTGLTQLTTTVHEQ